MAVGCRERGRIDRRCVAHQRRNCRGERRAGIRGNFVKKSGLDEHQCESGSWNFDRARVSQLIALHSLHAHVALKPAIGVEAATKSLA